ncbi:MAG TPA: hypothetical protein VKX28_23745 [Xanthobacteraceae bacterium]|nr:hypothetical protein [Xanthobacteraceae bacterium]
MSRDVILGLAAATLVGIMLVPGDARAHHGRHHVHHLHHLYGLRVCGPGAYRGWTPFNRNPGQAGYPGPHYGCDCYRAANGRAMCRFF